MMWARSIGVLPRKSATPFSVAMTFTLCSVWSQCETFGTIALIRPPFATDGQVYMDK